MPALRSHPEVFLSVESPATPDGAALSIVALTSNSSEALDAALEALSLAPLTVGSMRLTDLLGVDQGLAIRWSPALAHLTPHGGALICRRLVEAIERAGILAPPPTSDPRCAYPEAADLVEACALEAIAWAASPRAIDVLLQQRDRWRRCRDGSPARVAPGAIQTALNHLLRPPTVVLLGAPNIGKSTLTNALAGRTVSIVADEPGVTRDHVGVSLEVDGLAIRLIDAPGLAPASSAKADTLSGRRLAIAAAARADLLVLCADPASPFSDPADLGIDSGIPLLRLGLRSDLGEIPGAQLAVSIRQPGATQTVATTIRRRLLPDAALACPDLWRFHPALPPEPVPG